MNLNNLDLNKIRVFRQVMIEGSSSRAAESLHLTRSAVSQSLAALEEALQTTLFHRVGRRLHPTEQASQFFQQIEPHLLRVEAAMQGLQGVESQVVVLRVGALPEFAKSQLAGLLRRFRELYPRLQLKLVFASPSRLQELLDRHRLDVCFSIFPHHDSPDILCQKVFREELVLVAPVGMASRCRSSREMEQLPVIDYFENHQLFPRWFTHHFRRAPALASVDYVATAEMVLAMVSEGLGVGVVPSYLVSEQHLSRLKVIRPTRRDLIDHIWLSRYRHRESSKPVADFSRFVREHFRAAPR